MILPVRSFLLAALLAPASLAGQSVLATQADSLGEAAEAAAERGEHPGRIARLWYLAAAAWSEEAARAVIAEDFERFARARRPYNDVRAVATYWHGRACLTVEEPGIPTQGGLDYIAGAWVALGSGGLDTRLSGRWTANLLDGADSMRARAETVAACNP